MRRAANHHLLVVGDDVVPDEVEALALSAFDDVRAETRDLLVGGELRLSGPWAVTGAVANALDLPSWAAQAWVAHVAPERSEPVPAELQIPGGLLEVFAAGEPIGWERQVLDFLIAAARRLAGAVRTDAGPVLEPDPDSAVDLVVLTDVWLDPDALGEVLASDLPGVDVLPKTGAWGASPGSRHDAAPPPNSVAAHHALSAIAQAERDRWHAVMDDVDARAAEHAHLLDSYAALWRDPDSARDAIVVTVEGSELPPRIVRGEPWASRGVVHYAIRWETTDAVEHATGRLSRAERARRERTSARVWKAALAVLGAVGGELVDADGFLLDPEPDPDPEGAFEA